MEDSYDSYDGDSVESQLNSVMGGGIFGGVIGLIIGLAVVIGLWKLFTKSGKPGFYSLIPVLNIKTLVDITGLPSAWFWYLLLGLMLSSITFGITGLISLYALFIIFRQLLRVFGKSDSVGTVLFYMVFSSVMLPYLGFSNATYLGFQPTNDVRVLPWIK
jgi:hypothetical protein